MTEHASAKNCSTHKNKNKRKEFSAGDMPYFLVTSRDTVKIKKAKISL
jgi:hypothetical protein